VSQIENSRFDHSTRRIEADTREKPPHARP
jgi:hypothetical protein